jgi:site-specific DNA-methyltransferase (adenine-specific)
MTALHYEDAGLRLWHGSNKDILPTFADESFDSIVTDPPYELGFMGKGWDSTGIAYDVDVWRECLRVLKPGGHLLAFGGTRTWHRIAVAIEDAGFEVRDSIAWLYGSGFPKSMNVAKAIASGTGRPEDIRRLNMGEAYEPSGRGRVNYDNGSASKMDGAPVDVDLPDSAQPWEGWGTALKPAFEPIIVARKPFRGTVAANVLAYGTGALNIDATRIHTPGSEAKVYSVARTAPGATQNATGRTKFDDGTRYEGETKAGRWPTNVVLDESQADALDAQTGVLKSGTGAVKRASSADRDGNRGAALGAESRPEGTPMLSYGDSGGASRFFPTFRYEAKAPTSERPNVDGTVHATVKPLELMRWLVRLVTRPGGRVLDIYAGSGTTGEAALLEGMEVDLIELEAEHLPLILARLRKPLHPAMFGDWDEGVA